MDEDSIVALNSVQGIEYVRPPYSRFFKEKRKQMIIQNLNYYEKTQEKSRT